jgi:ferrous iron transport protein A
MKKISLVQMKEKQKGKVVEFVDGSNFVNKIMSMGIYPGRKITKLSHFVFKGPITIKVGRTVLALGHGMASRIIVEIIE